MAAERSPSASFRGNPDGSRIDHVYAGGQLVCDLITPSAGAAQTYYYLSDHLGSVSLVTDPNGNVVQDTTYEPFGEIYDSSGTSPNHRFYTGQEADDESGLYFYGACYYDPLMGRFVSPDSIVPSAMDPQSMNRYAYCRNNPIVLTDPSGHSWLSTALKVGTTVFPAFAPSLTYNAWAGNIQTTQDLRHYGSQAVVYNAAIVAVAACIDAATVPDEQGTTFFGRMFGAGFKGKGFLYVEDPGAEVASVDTGGNWNVLGLMGEIGGGGGAAAGVFDVGYHLWPRNNNNGQQNQPGYIDHSLDTAAAGEKDAYEVASSYPSNSRNSSHDMETLISLSKSETV